MNTSVEITSKILARLLPVTSIAAIIYTIVYTIEDYTYLTDVSSVNDFGFLGYIFTWPIVAGLVIVRIIAVVIIIKGKSSNMSTIDRKSPAFLQGSRI